MKLLDYIKGLRKGKDAYRIEREAMDDPFLSDALEGFDSVDGMHAGRIERLQKQIRDKSRSGNAHLRTWSMAASILICVSIGGYLLWNKDKPSYTIAMVNEELAPVAMEESAPVISDETEKSIKQTPAVETEAKNEIVIARKQAEPIIRQEKADDVADVLHPAEESSAQMEAEVASAQEVTDFKDLPADSSASSQIALLDKKQTAGSVSVVAFGASKDQAQSKRVVSTGKKIKSVPVIGMEAYQDYLKKNRTRSEDKDCTDKKGKVVLVFSVNAGGKPFNIHVKTSICPRMDAEAIRLLTEGCLWTVSPDTVELIIEF